jgi:NAD(P)-dependent dehydrogenase (short-subunit alcohol dehydrogenase family)
MVGGVDGHAALSEHPRVRARFGSRHAVPWAIATVRIMELLSLPVSDASELEGRVAVITGGGVGIGRAIALRLAAAGAVVVVSGRNIDPLDETVERIRENGGEAEARVADVREPGAVEELIDSSVARWKTLDILVNNAGIVVPPSPIATFREDAFDRIVAVNVKGVFLGMRYGLPHMLRQGGGVVLNVSSVSAVRNVRNLGPYAATKHAVVALTRAAATENGAFGIRVNALLPGPTRTRMVVGLPDAPTGADDSFAAQVPLGRISEPEEQAEAALFLVSGRSSFVNGASLLVDGGLAWVD